MSRTDKTKPFWVKLAHGDLKTVEVHNHTDGRCDCRARGRERRSPTHY